MSDHPQIITYRRRATSARVERMGAALSGSSTQPQHEQNPPAQISGRSRTREAEAVPTRNDVGPQEGPSTSGAAQNSDDRQRPAQRRNLPQSVEVGERRKYTIEILEYGTIMPHELWSTRHAIFPKGFKSRVRYWSVLEPSVWCNYISEILDAGLVGPIFMVSVEGNPSEVFAHVYPKRCWELVVQKANELNKEFYQANKRRGTPTNPHHVQKLESIDGLEMFGLSAPAVLRALEALDRGHASTEYWRFKNQSRVGRTPRVAATQVQQQNPLLRRRAPQALQHDNPYPIMQEFFKKANPLELRALETVLRNGTRSSSTRQEVALLLSEEIRSRHQ